MSSLIKKSLVHLLVVVVFIASMVGAWWLQQQKYSNEYGKPQSNTYPQQHKKTINLYEEKQQLAFNKKQKTPKLVQDARKQIGVTTIYDPAYVNLTFPNGDVPKERGVCTDVVIRAYRQQGKDLQRLVNKDMKRAWSAYPTKRWGLKRPDKNIDHRRVPNLRVFFKRHGKSLNIPKKPQHPAHIKNFKAGDMVTWLVGGRLPHIGIVSDKKSTDGIPLIIHNIGRGTQEENVLFNYKITGHYRY